MAATSLLSVQQQQGLKELARRSITYFLQHQKLLKICLEDLEGEYAEVRATFVTLTKAGRLRGCMGELLARQELAYSVVENAVNAACNDPRFPTVTLGELSDIDIEISILTTPEALTFENEAGLLSQITPGRDGLILRDGGYQGTFLPSVWEELPTKELFWSHLKSKAGLPSHHWSSTLEVWRYQVDKF